MRGASSTKPAREKCGEGPDLAPSATASVHTAFPELAALASGRKTAQTILAPNDGCFRRVVLTPVGGECRRSDQVAKHHGQLATLGLGWRRCGRRPRCRCRYQGWGRLCGAERGDGRQELATMADRGHADGDQVLSRQVRQNVSVDFVVAERRLVLSKTELL
jgi:hypothetical protein